MTADDDDWNFEEFDQLPWQQVFDDQGKTVDDRNMNAGSWFGAVLALIVVVGLIDWFFRIIHGQA